MTKISVQDVISKVLANRGRFSHIFGGKIGDFLKTNVLIKFFQNLALFWVKNGIFADFFVENIFKNIASVPGKRLGTFSADYKSGTYIRLPFLQRISFEINLFKMFLILNRKNQIKEFSF
jgi:hypothetical protein